MFLAATPQNSTRIAASRTDKRTTGSRCPATSTSGSSSTPCVGAGGGTRTWSNSALNRPRVGAGKVPNHQLGNLGRR